MREKPISDVYALTHAISTLTCLDANRRGIEPPAMALADMYRALRNLSDDQAGEFVEALGRALDILKGHETPDTY